LEYVYANVKSDRLKFCFDSGHQNCHLHSKDLDLLSMYGDKLISLHLHDNDGTQDQHMLPFEGNIKWETTMKKITSCGYIGATALEVTKNTSYESFTCIEFLNLAYERAKCLDEFRYKCSV
jgi:sugar phosphate isomerase/epimerase